LSKVAGPKDLQKDLDPENQTRSVLRPKAEQRVFFQTELAKTLNEQDQRQLDRQLVDHLTDFLRAETASRFLADQPIWGMFRAFGPEPSLQTLTQLKLPIRWVYPRIQGQDLVFYQPGPDGFERHRWGMEEPVINGAKEISLDHIQGFLVPGLGFDQVGVRLGRGRGFYDRMLTRTKATKVGVGYSIQVVEKLPTPDPWDVLMTHVATELGVTKVKR